MTFLCLLSICRLLVHITPSQYSKVLPSHSERTPAEEPSTELAAPRCCTPSAPCTAAHRKHHTQNPTYFGGPRLQAVGVAANKKSHFLGWEKKFPFSNKSHRGKEKKKKASKILPGFLWKVINQSSKYRCMQLLRLEFHTELDYSSPVPE